VNNGNRYPFATISNISKRFTIHDVRVPFESEGADGKRVLGWFVVPVLLPQESATVAITLLRDAPQPSGNLNFGRATVGQVTLGNSVLMEAKN
jgi:hypothetical protein